MRGHDHQDRGIEGRAHIKAGYGMRGHDQVDARYIADEVHVGEGLDNGVACHPPPTTTPTLHTHQLPPPSRSFLVGIKGSLSL